MDYILFQLINNLVGKWQTLDAIGIFCAEYLIFLMAIAVACFLIVRKDGAHQKVRRAAAIIFSVALGYFLKIIIQFFYFRPRPFADYDVFQLVNKSADSASFPSGHTAVAFALAFAIYFYNKKLGYILLILAALVGLGRIYVGVHYPLDILGGILIGALSALAIKTYLPRFSALFKSRLKPGK